MTLAYTIFFSVVFGVAIAGALVLALIGLTDFAYVRYRRWRRWREWRDLDKHQKRQREELRLSVKERRW